MKRLAVGALGVVLFAAASLAGPNEGGVLFLHANDGLTYTTDNSGYCASPGISQCDSANVSVSVGPTHVFFVLAAFLPDTSPRLSGVSFGIDYDDQDFVLLDGAACSDFELAQSDWPDPGKGTSLTWTSAQTDTLQALYWFAGYANATTTFELVPHPFQLTTFADDSAPAILDAVSAFGSLGFGEAGSGPCPSATSPAGAPGYSPPTSPSPGSGPLASSGPSRPSNDTEPFHRVHIYNDLDSLGGCVFRRTKYSLVRQSHQRTH